MTKTTFIRLLIVVMLLFVPRSLLADTVYLFGKIGDFPIAASLQRNGEKLAGWYFYHSQAKEIRLEGQMDRNGTFSLEELTGGKKTGIFEGSVEQGRWTGIWRKAAGATPLAFNLEENRNQLKKLSGVYACTATERFPEHRYTYRWEVKLTSEDGVIKELYSTQGAYSDDKVEQTCTIDLMDLKQVASEVGIMLQARGDNSEEEGKRCTVKILGDSDILWIRFGDSSEVGNDCRSVGSSMFCSPRAFWNDIIVDRRTRKCKALR